MGVDLEGARLIGRHVLDATMPSPIDWSCAWSHDELADSWVLFVDYIGSTPPGVVPPRGDAPIVVAKSDGSVTRTLPDGPMTASNRHLDERFHHQLAVSMTARYTARQLQAIARLRYLRFYLPDGRDWRSDSLRFSVVARDASEVATARGLLQISEGTGRQWPPVNSRLGHRPAGVEQTADHLIIDIVPEKGEESPRLSDDDLAFAAELDARLDGLGLEVDVKYSMWSWRGMIDPAAFPEVFAPPP